MWSGGSTLSLGRPVNLEGHFKRFCNTSHCQNARGDKYGISNYNPTMSESLCAAGRRRSCALTFLLLSRLLITVSGCQSCLMPSIAVLHHWPERVWKSPTPTSFAATVSGLAILRHVQRPVLQKSLAGVVVGTIAVRAFQQILIHRSDDGDTTEGTTGETSHAPKPPLTTAMVATIGVYKNFISPLLPPACRFLPTCSQYGVQAIEEFGPTKGAILTSWRLLRCSPFGGKGYDPPRWPPVSYTYSSY
jgi:uncharacterized protein